ncbi:hypothetical protein BCIN_12g05140 [Botrytis cinerea B05.10]|uniref:F-box domain-containing protein n=1 Tax=Botryotinia fuckeliana (strain B05.10) TaxID=332648 RepID=A0A384JZN0_BOTFB|nr:hypothetical protein BCIN_12g05140 [Botrytis cinerea B05.10]ATZ55971.1 hypothetical protein BCIN_12g05140 [Botrytis cinerea B05.10]
MQPSPPDNTNRIITFENPSDLPNSSNHGIHSPQLQSSELVSPRNGLGNSTASSTPSTSSSGTGSGWRSPLNGVDEALRGLNLDTNMENRPRPSYQRIAEYENALAPSPPRKQPEGPGFKVVKKKGSTGEEGPQLENFPNEVLTHILSHLPASSLSAVSLVSRRFYNLVTTPHAWRVAFSRFFPGQDVTEASPIGSDHIGDDEEREQFREQRFFTRLTGLASWRSEYVIRTRLLRSLGRGKPAQGVEQNNSSRTNGVGNTSAVTTYTSELFTSINHIHGTFGQGKKYPRFIHGTDETGSAGSSDPKLGRIDPWGLTDPQPMPQFADLFPGDVPFGLGNGPAGLPNVMDVSQPFGMVYGEGFPGGSAYYRAPNEGRGRFLEHSPPSLAEAESGIPNIPPLTEAMSSVWIAKSSSVPKVTNDIIGIMTGSTLGVITAYSLGTENPKAKAGQVMARWIPCPGVPIVAIKVDDSYSSSRKTSRRTWAVALNALGEVFYLTEIPTHPPSDASSTEDYLGREAWIAGRTVYWQVVEASRRIARDDPWHQAEIHGSYSPKSSCTSMNLSKQQLKAETREIEKFLRYRPSHFRTICNGWDMRRRLEVDFSGDDGNGAGESVFVIGCGIASGDQAEIKRYTRCKVEQSSLDGFTLPRTAPATPPISSEPTQIPSIFGNVSKVKSEELTSPSSPISPMSKIVQPSGNADAAMDEEWRSSLLSLKSYPGIEITTSAIDLSTYALVTIDEDPLHTVNGKTSFTTFPETPSDETSSTSIPGYRARYLAIGTKIGQVILWNMRGPQSANPQVVNELHPIRTIVTESPQISCLAISALFVVHGGNDGLVQAWDPLASSNQPVRTLHSRFSSRARRRLIQAEARIHGVGINLYAAGAIVLDPDPTILRGMVSLGTHLRYWHYSSSAADQFQTKKRRLRRGERGSNGATDRFSNTGRGALLSQIALEQQELDQEKKEKAKEAARFAGRFGVGFGGLSEEEALQYAEMVSAQALIDDEERRISEAGYFADTGENSPTKGESSFGTITPEASTRSHSTVPTSATEPQPNYDHDLEEAIRLSLMDGQAIGDNGYSPSVGDYDVNFTYKQKKTKRSESTSPSTSQVSKNRFSYEGLHSMDRNAQLSDDLEFALQLSLAEERSKQEAEAETEAFPGLGFAGKGKGKGRAI